MYVSYHLRVILTFAVSGGRIKQSQCKERYGDRKVEKESEEEVNMTYAAWRVTTPRDKRRGNLLEPTKKMEKSVT